MGFKKTQHFTTNDYIMTDTIARETGILLGFSCWLGRLCYLPLRALILFPNRCSSVTYGNAITSRPINDGAFLMMLSTLARTMSCSSLGSTATKLVDNARSTIPPGGIGWLRG